MEILNQIASRIDLFLLILARVSGIFITGPMLSNRSIPNQVKISFSIILAMVLFAGLNLPTPVIPNQLEQFTLLFIGEILIGLIIGFVASFTFAAVQFAGQIVDMQMGFSIVNILDPIYGTQAPMMGSFKNLLALLLFMATNSHHYLFAALYESYKWIPIFGIHVGDKANMMIMDLFSGMLTTGIKIAIPIAGALFVAEVALGLVARTMPEMQVYFVGMPLKLFLGLVMLMMVMPLYITFLQTLFDSNYKDILRMLQVLS